jgi:hypothetical protein
LPPRTGPELWIVDESSLLATRPTNRILKAARQQGVERILFVGDQRQHHAIEAGAPVRQLLADNMVVAELQVIRRQRDPELKRAVELAARGKAGEALSLLAEQRRLTEISETTARYQHIALDYLRAYEAGQNTLVVSPGNDERQALNEEIRKLLIQKGHVQNRGCDYAILVRRDLTRAQLAHARNYQQGDVLAFSRGSKKRGIAKGANLSVENVDAKRNALTLHMGDGTRMALNPARWRGVQVFRPEPRTIAVGDRIQFRAPQRSLKVANGEFATIIALDTAQATLRLDSNARSARRSSSSDTSISVTPPRRTRRRGRRSIVSSSTLTPCAAIGSSTPDSSTYRSVVPALMHTFIPTTCRRWAAARPAIQTRPARLTR